MKGLVLEGGAMRGMFTAGVLDVLMENNIHFDGGIGVSAGACFGVNYKSRQIGRVLRYNRKYAGDKRLASWESWLKTGDLYGADFCYRVLPTELDVFDAKTFAENPMAFWCVATDINLGRPVYYKMNKGRDRDLQWIRASSSIPVFARPVPIAGHYYWDGGVSDSIPIAFFQRHGYNKNVVILTQPKNYCKHFHTNTYRFLQVALRKYPKVLRDLKNRAKNYNLTLEKLLREEKSGQTFVIRPPFALEIGTVEKDPRKIEMIYDVGRCEAEKQISALKKYLA